MLRFALILVSDRMCPTHAADAKMSHAYVARNLSSGLSSSNESARSLISEAASSNVVLMLATNATN